MSDLIRREDAIQTLKSMMQDCFPEAEEELDAVVTTVREIPSAEPERKKGKWIDGMPYVNSHWKVCSECHETAPNSAGGYNFCPNCGVEMTRGEHE